MPVAFAPNRSLQPIRSKYTDQDKNYSLRDSEINSLSEVGKFRVVASNAFLT